MQLDQLTHWRLEGQPDVFTETRDGEEWQVIHSGGKIHHAGFLQAVYFGRLVKEITLSACVSLFSPGGGLALRLGIDPYAGTDAQSENIIWGSWYAPENEWVAGEPTRVQHTLSGLQRYGVTLFLESKCLHPVQANTSRWRDVQLEVEYAGVDPGPTPDPEPEPEPEPGIPGQIARALAEITERLERIDVYLAQWGKAQEWVDEYNSNREV